MVGPAPLRRLSNSEYLNALHDLFPNLRPTLLTLPELPSDTVVAGFDNAADAQQPSDVRIARYEAIANGFAESATADAAAMGALTGCDDWGPDAGASCARAFIEATGRRIFRRPLTVVERDRLELRFATWMESLDFEAAVRLTLSAMLQDPRFVYRVEPAPPASGAHAGVVDVEPYAMASRLSFFLWESVPDEVLLEAASRDELRGASQIRAQADRMLSDDRARRVFWSFHRQWLGLDRILEEEHLLRTPEVDAAWTAASQRSAFTESRLFVENTLMASGSLRDLADQPASLARRRDGSHLWRLVARGPRRSPRGVAPG